MTTTNEVSVALQTRAELHSDGWTDNRIARAIRSGHLHRVTAGTYTHMPPTVEQRIHAVTQRWGDVVVVLDSAARLHRLPEPWPSDGLLHVAVPPGHEQPQRPGICVHTWKLRDDEVCEVGSIRMTTVERTVADLVCLRDRLSAVAAIDGALQGGLVTPEDIRRLAATTTHRRGAARGRSVWAECDGRAESPLETRVRLRASDAGFPPDHLQQQFDLGIGRAFADLSWKRSNGRWLVGEADGTSVHATPEALFADRRRANSLVATGDVDIVRFVWADTVPRWRVGATIAPLLTA